MSLREMVAAVAITLAAGVLVSIAADDSQPAAEPACVAWASTAEDAERFIAEALDVLRSCGHNPAHYRVRLLKDDPFVAAGSGRKPTLTVMFLPYDLERHYALAVNVAHPCVVSWVWQPADFTDWQRRVIARAETLAKTSGLPRRGGQLLDVLVTESLDLVGIEVLDTEPGRNGPSSELRVLMHKDDLSLVESD
jgi:hypothetical protein